MTQTLVTLGDIAARLAPALGGQRSIEVVTGAARALDILSPTLAVRDALKLLDALAKEPGVVGTAARFAVRRYAAELAADDPGATEADEETEAPESARPGRSDSRPERTFTAHQLVAAFTSSLGEEKAREAVLASLARMSLDPKTALTQDGALKVLDDLASVPGLVGVTARFAKARLILRK